MLAVKVAGGVTVQYIGISSDIWWKVHLLGEVGALPTTFSFLFGLLGGGEGDSSGTDIQG